MDDLRVAFIGQSVGSHAFSAEFYSAASDYCQRSGILAASIVLADEPHRFSFMAIRGMDESAAIAATKRIADEKFKFLQKIAARYPLYTIHRWNEFAAFPAFKQLLNVVEAEYRSGSALRDAINQRFLDHVREVTPDAIVGRGALDLGARYIVAELALMLLMYGPLGYQVQISPFRVPAFLQVALTCTRILALRELRDLRNTEIERAHVTLSAAEFLSDVEPVRIGA